MGLSVKTRIADLFRRIGMSPQLESWLGQRAKGKAVSHFICKILPAHYLYPSPSIRIHYRDGLRLKLDISDFIDHSLFFGFRGTEDESYQNLMNLIEPDYNCIDVGTKNGYVSLRMARLAHKGMTLGFEPDPVNYQQSIDNLGLNTTNNLTIHNIGLGDHRAEGRMEVRTVANRGGNRIARGTDGGAIAQIERLDDIVKAMNAESVNLIKIDVEGYELNVLRGAVGVLSRNKPVLFIEVDEANLQDQGASAIAIVGFLEEHGYKDLTHAGTGERVSVDADFNGCHFDLIAR